MDTWVIVGPDGLAYVGLHKSAYDAWVIFLGWPDDAEITEKKRAGWYAAKATLSWSKP